jgi:hypothetical protein
MERELHRPRLDGRHKASLAVRPPGRPAPAVGATAFAPWPTASPPRQRATDRVLMAVRVRCQPGCPRYLTPGSDNFRPPLSGLTAE